MEFAAEVADVETVSGALTRHGYLPDEGLATAVFLAIALQRPLLLEGEAGVGKTEVAKVLAAWTGGELIRLQCYEGIDATQAVYDWDYGRQLLHLRAAEATGESSGRSTDALEAELYQERFLVKRALLRAIERREGPPPVLLIDEIDRADDEFEAYLLEILSDWQVTVPELGVFRTDRPPLVVLTSNRTRDVHDALKRRCLYHWVEHPGFEREVAIVQLRAPDVDGSLARQVAGAVEALAVAVAVQAAGRGRDHRLGHGARSARRPPARRGVGGGHDRHGAQVPRGPRAGGAARVRRHRAAGDGAERALGVTAMTAPAMASSPDELAVGFARTLRGCGLAVPISTVVGFAEALGVIGLARRDDVYWAGRATLVRRPEDQPALRPGVPRSSGTTPTAAKRSARIEPPDTDHDRRRRWRRRRGPAGRLALGRTPHRAAVQRGRSAASQGLRQLRRRRAGRGPPADGPHAADRHAPPIAAAASGSGRGQPDLRRTLRAALKTDGEPIRRLHRARSTKHRRLVLLVDVSGSMEPYARSLLRFVQAAVAGRRQVEAFAIGTRLTRITRELGSRDPDRALRQAAARVVDWSGGTRLGDGLAHFNDEWGVRGMARGAVVVILSDGWDRGDPAALSEQLIRLRRVAHRIVWVNPLKVTPGYAPLARGMAAALPHVDRFVEGHSIAAMEHLAEILDES